MKTLQELLHYPGISSIVSDSRKVQKGSIFVAVHGGTQDGHEFISQAQSQGAIAVVGERDQPSGLNIQYVKVQDSRQALAQLAAAFYGDPSHSMCVVGVTGTSGKTTTTYLIESILKAAGHRVGVIGTVNFRYEGRVYDSTHTTPGAVELQHLLADMKKAGCTAVVMEVSSHSLKQHRTDCIAFDGVVFTNLSPEHLDFHPDMEDYFLAKKLLFTNHMEYSVAVGKKPYAAINQDEEYGKRLFNDLSLKSCPGLRFGGYAFTSQLQASLSGIHGQQGDVAVDSVFAGLFNAYNILAAVDVCRGMGMNSDAISKGVSDLKAVPGRLERVPNLHNIHVFVDYAHKPDALDKVLRTLREVKGVNRLITVFGCGGDRDRTKRPVMGRIATELSDFVFVTSDNPRRENPQQIISQIVQGVVQGIDDKTSHFRVEADRRAAIFEAIAEAKAGDIVVIAGKGHEDYQIIADPSSPAGNS